MIICKLLLQMQRQVNFPVHIPPHIWLTLPLQRIYLTQHQQCAINHEQYHDQPQNLSKTHYLNLWLIAISLRYLYPRYNMDTYLRTAKNLMPIAVNSYYSIHASGYFSMYSQSPIMLSTTPKPTIGSHILQKTTPHQPYNMDTSLSTSNISCHRW